MFSTYTFSANTKIKSSEVNQNFLDIVSNAIVDADISVSAAIALSKLATGALPTAITVASANIVDDSIVDADINSAAAITLTKLANGTLPSGIHAQGIVNADIAAAAAIAQSKLLTTILAINVVTTNVTAATSNGETKVDITGATITFTPDGTRNVLVIGYVRLYNQSAADNLMLTMVDAATEVARTRGHMAVSNAPIGLMAMKYYPAPAASSKTVKLKMSTTGLSGGINCEADSNAPGFIMAIII